MSEQDNGWEFAKRLSDALLKVRPLGGSEMFVKRNNSYYADPSYCGQLIDEKAESEIKWIKRAISAEKNNEALVKALEETRNALDALKNAVEASQKMNGREYIDLGIQVNNALGHSFEALTAAGRS